MFEINFFIKWYLTLKSVNLSKFINNQSEK